MFGFGKSKAKANPPTDKQLKYAARLGVKVKSGMSRDDLSAAISRAEKKNPKAKQQRETINRKRKEAANSGPPTEMELLLNKWQKIAESDTYILAIYDRGKTRTVDVLHVIDAHPAGARVQKLKLTLASPKTFDDGWLLYEKEFELPYEKLVYHEVLKGDYHGDASKPYQAAVKRGLKIAKKL